MLPAVLSRSLVSGVSLGLMLLAGALALLLGGCERAAGGLAGEVSPPPRPVQVAAVREAAAADVLRLPGTLRAVRRASPAFLHAGYLAERRVALGQQVRAGEVLATLHNPSLQPGVLAAEAAVREARETAAQLERDAARLEELAQRRLVAEDEAERAGSRRDAANEGLARAQAALREAREQLAEATLRAPFDGVVMDVHVEAGDFVAAGQPVVSLAAPERLELRLELPAARAARLAPGSEVTVFRAADGSQTAGRLRELGVAQPGRAQPLVVELAPAPAGWQPGEAVYALLHTPTGMAVSVPIAAIVDPGTGRSRVFRVRGNRAEAVDVRLGALLGGQVEVHGELARGDLVIVAGQAMLLDGEPVRVLP